MSKPPIFEPGIEDFDSFVERLELFFLINGTEDRLKKGHFCVNLNPGVYAELKILLAPVDFAKATYDQCVQALSTRYKKISKVIPERYKFNSRKQQSGESLQDYVSEIKRLSTKCNYGSFLDQALRDRLVSGLRNTSMVSRLLSEKDTMSFDEACSIIFEMEAVEQSTLVMAGSSSDSFMVSSKSEGSASFERVAARKSFRSPVRSTSYQSRRGSSPRRGSPFRGRSPSPSQRSEGGQKKRCRYCYSRHTPDKCPANKWLCYNCECQGHTAEFCGKQQVNFVVTGVNVSVNVLKSQSDSLFVNIVINGKSVRFLVDTGSSISILSYDVAKELQLLSKILPYYGTIKGVGNHLLDVIGKCEVSICYGKLSTIFSAVIIRNVSCPAILGRDWLSVLAPNWGITLLPHLYNEGEVGLISRQETCMSVQSSIEEYVQSLSVKFPKVFSKQSNDKPIEYIKVNLNLKENVPPVFHKAYTVPYALRNEVGLELDRLESKGIITKVKTSDWASPLVLVPKGNGKIRLCADFKATLNKFLKVDQHPMPIPEDIFNQFTGCTVFCRLDLTEAYLQLEVHEASKDFLVVNTIRGLYRFNRLCFGLSPACAIFQSVIDSILVGIDHVAPYLDDILIGGKDLATCKEVLNKVMIRLEEYNVKLNVQKSEFFVNSLLFLGFELSGKGKVPSATKIEKILSMPPPENLTQLKAFVSMFNYYRNFVHMCPDILEPFHKLMRKDEPWVWSSECMIAFSKCKTALSEASMLVLYDPSKELILSVDSSSFGVGAILSQIENGEERPIAFESATLNQSQRNYSQLDKEALAIIFGVKKFHKYLWGRKFTIFSDHLPLKTIFGEQKKIPVMASSRLIRWATTLSAYNYSLVHKKGTLIPHADVLSRLPSSDSINDKEVLFTYLSTPMLDLDEVSEHTRNDKLMSRVLEYVLKGFPNSCADELKVYERNKCALSVSNNCLFFGDRIIVP